MKRAVSRASCALAFAAVLGGSSAAFAEEEEKKNEPDPTSQLLWLDAEAGVENASLNTFTEDFDKFSLGFLPRNGVGPMGGAALGVRLVFVTLGVRGRVASFTDTEPSHSVHEWSMASIDGEVGLRIPLHRLEPYLTFAGGYTTLGGIGDAIDGLQSGLNANGFDVRTGFGLDYYVSKHVSIGALGTFELLGLTRPGVPARDVAALPQSQTVGTAAMRFIEANGSSYGTALALTGGLKVHL